MKTNPLQDTIYSVIDAHQFLQLPRLSSQSVFDSLCPPGSARNRKRLCVVLFTSVVPEHEKYRASLREFSRKYKFSPERVRFSYVFVERQKSFVDSFRYFIKAFLKWYLVSFPVSSNYESTK